jgi:hypothetical protein
MKPKSIYLIFMDRRDIFNYITIKCVSGELNQALVKKGLMMNGNHWQDFSWVIFKDSVLLGAYDE